jgi:hypothetical protein
MFLKQNAGQYRNIETSNKSFENIAKLKPFGTKLVNKISMCEVIYDRIISENATVRPNFFIPICYLLVEIWKKY